MGGAPSIVFDIHNLVGLRKLTVADTKYGEFLNNLYRCLKNVFPLANALILQSYPILHRVD